MKWEEKKEYLEVIKRQGNLSEDTIHIINSLINLEDEINKWGITVSVLLVSILIIGIIALFHFW